MKALILTTLLTTVAMATETTIFSKDPDPRGCIYEAILITDDADADRIYLSLRLPDGSEGKTWSVWKSTDNKTWSLIKQGKVEKLFVQVLDYTSTPNASYTFQVQ